MKYIKTYEQEYSFLPKSFYLIKGDIKQTTSIIVRIALPMKNELLQRNLLLIIKQLEKKSPNYEESIGIFLFFNSISKYGIEFTSYKTDEEKTSLINGYQHKKFKGEIKYNKNTDELELDDIEIQINKYNL